MKRILPVMALILSLAQGICSGQDVSAPKSIQLTVYNSNFALVKDTRSVTLNNGVNSIEIEDVAARIDPTSILFKSLTAPNSVSILEQNYQYDLINPTNILNKSVGRRVTFTNYDDSGKPYTQSGILMSPASVPNDDNQRYYQYNTGTGNLVVKTDDGKVVLAPSGQISIEEMPEGLHPRPTLNWLLQSSQAGKQDAEISYITQGINWNADYVALVNKENTALDLAGWVTLDNKSGASYQNAKLTLMAGDVRRIDESRAKWNGKLDVIGSAADYAPKPQFQEQSFFEYHMYTMQRPTTIRDNETKQLSLLNASGASVTTEMVYDGRKEWWQNWWYPGRTDLKPGVGYDTSTYHKVNIVLEVKNSKVNHMGMPLPKGKIRVYKLDNTGGQQFIGEDSIDHTPIDEKIRLYVGDAFDVVGDYKRTNYNKIAENIVEETFETVIRNHKKTAVEVRCVDHVWSDWQITEASHKYNKKDAHTIEFPVKVPANGETTVTYTIRTKW